MPPTGPADAKGRADANLGVAGRTHHGPGDHHDASYHLGVSHPGHLCGLTYAVYDQPTDPAQLVHD